MIIASAIRDDLGIVHVGHRHWNVLCSPGYDRSEYKGGTQGFITDRYIFLDRKEAWKHAVKYGQIPRQKWRPWWKRPKIHMNGKLIRVGKADRLMSENVWPCDPPEWKVGLDWRK